MSYKLTISKDEINELPLYKFQGEIHIIETAEDALVAANKLAGEAILGFDTETRAAFKKGERYDISLLQLATETDAYLFRLNKCRMIPEIIAILADASVVKSGVAVRDDILGLQKLAPFKEENFIDLAHMAKDRKIEKFGLRALTAICLGKRLSKRAKLSNWALENLSQAQIDYAACDAVVGFQIYEALNK